ncbi:MAG: FctA domain-containing protein [Eubacteriales bacterium]|nr:FctA domain-containing protein [Eubacteriales bacterium]
MKKLISFVLALVFVLSLSTAAFAEEVVDKKYDDVSTAEFTKTYTVNGVTASAPDETFEIENVTFVSATNTGVGYTEDWAKENLPQISSVAYTNGTLANNGKFTITLPDDYPSVGIYTYTFKEKDNGTAGVTYYSTQMKLVVTVIQQEDLTRVAAVHCEADGDKIGTFENIYTAGSLQVTKNVEGLLGDKESEFKIKVTFTAPDGDTVKGNITYMEGTSSKSIAPTDWDNGTASVEIMLKDDASVTFANIPSGVSYVVEETDTRAQATGGAAAEYTVTYDTAKTGTVTSTALSTTVTNTKDGTPDTGIVLDSMPYVLLLAVAVFGMAMMTKKRHCEN